MFLLLTPSNQIFIILNEYISIIIYWLKGKKYPGDTSRIAMQCHFNYVIQTLEANE